MVNPDGDIPAGSVWYANTGHKNPGYVEFTEFWAIRTFGTNTSKLVHPEHFKFKYWLNKGWDIKDIKWPPKQKSFKKLGWV